MEEELNLPMESKYTYVDIYKPVKRIKNFSYIFLIEPKFIDTYYKVVHDDIFNVVQPLYPTDSANGLLRKDTWLNKKLTAYSIQVVERDLLFFDIEYLGVNNVYKHQLKCSNRIKRMVKAMDDWVEKCLKEC